MAQDGYIDDPARKLYVIDREEHRPFKCPVIGCEKTYKNQNGLKYHKLHGHQNQKLHENPDGTFSIILILIPTSPTLMGWRTKRINLTGARFAGSGIRI